MARRRTDKVDVLGGQDVVARPLKGDRVPRKRNPKKRVVKRTRTTRY